MFVLTGSSGEYSDQYTTVLAVSDSREKLEEAIKLAKVAHKANSVWRSAKDKFYYDNYDSVVPKIPTPLWISKDHLGSSPADTKKRQEINVANNKMKLEWLAKQHQVERGPLADLLRCSEEYANAMYPERAELVAKAVSLHESYDIDEVPFIS